MAAPRRSLTFPWCTPTVLAGLAPQGWKVVVIRQAQGSTGQATSATARSATDPDVEQGLEGPLDLGWNDGASATAGRREVGGTGRPRGQVDRVNAARERGGDRSAAADGGKASKGGDAWRGRSERSRNVANPGIGSVLQHTRRRMEAQTVEVVRNHGGGTWSGGGRPFPKGTTTWSPGVDSRCRCPDGRVVFEEQGSNGVVRSAGNGRPDASAGNRGRDEARSLPERSTQGQKDVGAGTFVPSARPPEGPRRNGACRASPPWPQGRAGGTRLRSEVHGGQHEEPISAISRGRISLHP